MARYIDADALMEVIREHDYPLRSHNNSTDNGMFTLGIQQAIDEAPTIDAVPVVRCGECKHYNTSWYDKRDMLESFCRWDRDESPNDDDYCSYGEKMDGKPCG